MKKLLIVDDEPWVRQLYASCLRDSGYEVFEARGAQEALYMVDDHNPDMMILDFFMPLNNALSVLYELQGHADLAKIPIIVLSSAKVDIDDRNMRELNVLKILNKCDTGPLDLVEEIKTLYNMTSKSNESLRMGGGSNVDKK